MKKTMTLFTVLVLLASLTGCLTKKVSKSSKSSTTITSPTDNGDSSSGGDSTSDDTDPGSEPGLDNGDATAEYYSLELILHGTFSPNRYASTYTNGIMWSSQRDLASVDREIFRTDSTFNVRVVVLENPPQNQNDTHGNRCKYNDSYSKLSVSVCLRHPEGSCIQTHTFDQVGVDQVSKVKVFNNPPISNEPLVLEVTNISSDYHCQNNSAYCPVVAHIDEGCMRFKLQFSTDYTKDLPGERY
ncbi:hypothetical protein HBN50_11955 [Halobacteriovorax sp. GB3]|uniref:hypothetical protein n=1 Tax=Halobacteriovorax sp. GB3 TaxID=2719615 RepID=UPI00235E158B|nr:hypothetical protein [Halobacteriovorax sp. GB3]MDD0853815.1 hypothetical protein [Halobacteriovorax sp. GB3]